MADADRVMALGLTTALHVRDLDFEAALERSSALVDLDVGKAPWAIQTARLQGLVGRDPARGLDRAFRKNRRPAERAQLLAEGVRQKIVAGDLKAADEALKVLQALPSKKTRSWAKNAEGLLLAAKGDAEKAKRAFAKAARGRPKVAEAEVSLARLGRRDGSPPERSRLEALVNRTGHPAAKAALAARLLADGEIAGSSQLIEEVMWKAPTAGDLTENSLTIAELLERSGDPAGGAAMAERASSIWPLDRRPLQTLVDFARRQNDEETAMKWFGRLLELENAGQKGSAGGDNSDTKAVGASAVGAAESGRGGATEGPAGGSP